MTHHSSSCERKALYNSGVKNGAFNCHECRPGLDKNFRHVQVLQQMDCAAQGGVSILHCRVGAWAAAALQPHQPQQQGKGLRGQLLPGSMAKEQQGNHPNKLGSWKRFSCLDGVVSGPHASTLLHP